MTPLLSHQACGEFYTEEKLARTLVLARKMHEMELQRMEMERKTRGSSFMRIQSSVSSVGRRMVSGAASSMSRASLVSMSEIKLSDGISSQISLDLQAEGTPASSSNEVFPLNPKSGSELNPFSCRQAQKIAQEMISRADEEYGVATFHFEQIDAEERYRNERGRMLCQVRNPALPMTVTVCRRTMVLVVVVVTEMRMVVIVMIMIVMAVVMVMAMVMVIVMIMIVMIMMVLLMGIGMRMEMVVVVVVVADEAFAKSSPSGGTLPSSSK